MFSNTLKTTVAMLLLAIVLFALSGQNSALAFQAATSTLTPTSGVTQAAPAQATTTLTPTATTAPSATATSKPAATATKEATATAVPPTATKAATATSVAATATTTPTVKTSATVTPTVGTSATVTPTAKATTTVTPTVKATATPTTAPTATPTQAPKAPNRALSPSSGAVSSISTSFVIQNTDPATVATVSATFYDISGTATGPITKNIGPNLSATIDQRDSSGLPGSPSTFQGSVVLSSNTQLAAVVNEYGGTASLGSGFRADSYAGVSSGNAATSVLMPQLLKGIFDSNQNITYNSTIAIQNTSSSSTAHVTLTLFNQTAPIGPFTHSGIQIPPGTSTFIDLQSESSLSGAPVFFGPGSISSDLPVAVVVNQNAGGTLLVYTGFTSLNAATTLYAPQLLKNVYDSGQNMTYGTGMMVMTADQSTANVTVTYTNFDGTIVSETHPANPAVSIDQRFSSAVNMGMFFGSATISSSKPIVAMVNLVTNASGNGVRASTYSAFASGSGTSNVFIPQILKNYLDSGTGVNWGTGMVVRALTNVSGTVTIKYYNGGAQVGNYSLPIGPNVPMLNIDQRFDSALSGQSVVNGSAVLVSTVPIAATVNEVGSSAAPGDSTATYSGTNQ